MRRQSRAQPAVCLQLFQTASIKDAITASEDTSTALHTTRKQAAWIRRIIHAVTRSKSYAQRKLSDTDSIIPLRQSWPGHCLFVVTTAGRRDEVLSH